MVNLQKRSATPDTLGICYFRAPCQAGDEVRFPTLTKPVTEPVTKKHLPREKPLTKPVTEKLDQYRPTNVSQCFALALLVSIAVFGATFPRLMEFYLVKFGPTPSAQIIPPPPYYQGEIIKGLCTKGQYHTWVYIKDLGWVDP